MRAEDRYEKNETRNEDLFYVAVDLKLYWPKHVADIHSADFG